MRKAIKIIIVVLLLSLSSAPFVYSELRAYFDVIEKARIMRVVEQIERENLYRKAGVKPEWEKEMEDRLREIERKQEEIIRELRDVRNRQEIINLKLIQPELERSR